MKYMMYLINKLYMYQDTYIQRKKKNKQENNTAKKDFSITCHVTSNKRYYSQSQRKYAFLNSQRNKTCTRTEITVTERSSQRKK